MSILKAYRNYMRVVYFAALQGRFDFDRDYNIYCAVASVDVERIVRTTKALRRSLGVTAKQVKFTKVAKDEKNPASVKGSLANAVARYDRAKENYYKESAAEIIASARMHMTHTTGEQGKKSKKGISDGTLVAHYSDKRPRKISTPFGTDADNKEVF